MDGDAREEDWHMAIANWIWTAHPGVVAAAVDALAKESPQLAKDIAIELVDAAKFLLSDGDYGGIQAFVLRTLPDFWITGTVAGQTASVTLGPDYNGPVPGPSRGPLAIAIGDAGWDAEVVRGDGEGPATTLDLCSAALIAMIRALEAGHRHAQAQPSGRR